MKSVVFTYKTYRSLACPIIPLKVQVKRRWFEINAYVDSGASVSIFSIQDAARLGINYESKSLIYITVGDGSSIPVYLHKLPVRIGNTTLKATIGFSPRLGVAMNLLGRRDIFSRFDIKFSDRKRTVTFTT